MKTTIKKVITPAQPEVTIEQEIEVQLPFYSKSGKEFFRISENEDVLTLEHLLGLSQWMINIAPCTERKDYRERALKGKVITREEFYEVYGKAMKRITKSQKELI